MDKRTCSTLVGKLALIGTLNIIKITKNAKSGSVTVENSIMLHRKEWSHAKARKANVCW
jgi:hypothetical protein